MKRLAIALTALGAALAAPAGSSLPLKPHYIMAMTMYDDGKKVSEPRLEIAAGEAAQVKVAPGDGSSYNATIVVNPAENGRLMMSSVFEVKSDSAGTISASPRLLLVPGEQAAVEFGYRGKERGPFRAELTFTPVEN